VISSIFHLFWTTG